jgi:hypothetical protein
MKRIFVFLVVIIGFAVSANAQIAEQSIVVKCPGFSDRELFDFAQEWFNTTNRDLLSNNRKLTWNNNMFIRQNEKNEHSYKVYGEVEYSFIRGLGQTYVVFFSLKIECKNEKIKFSMGSGRGYVLNNTGGRVNVSLKSTDGDDEWELLSSDIQLFFTERIKTINEW